MFFIHSFTFHYGSTYTSSAVENPELIAYLHSTMVLLIRILFSSHPPEWQHLHSTMVLLIQNFNDSTFAPVIYLHSTMVLLIHSSLSNLLHSKQIYIPLWFYLYRSFNSFIALCHNLHSTMVLLIRILVRCDTALCSFTFHYGSTYTPSCSPLSLL